MGKVNVLPVGAIACQKRSLRKNKSRIALGRLSHHFQFPYKLPASTANNQAEGRKPLSCSELTPDKLRVLLTTLMQCNRQSLSQALGG